MLATRRYNNNPRITNWTEVALNESGMSFTFAVVSNTRAMPNNRRAIFRVDTGGLGQLQIQKGTNGNLSSQIHGNFAHPTKVVIGNNSLFHLCISFNNQQNTVNYYYNGTLANSVTGFSSNGNWTQPIEIGPGQDADWNGTLSNFRFWTGYALSASECNDVFQNDLNSTSSSGSSSTNTTVQNLIYDKNGNLVSGDGYYREYNELNQLIRIRNGNLSNSPVLEEFVWHPTEERTLIKDVYYRTLR